MIRLRDDDLYNIPGTILFFSVGGGVLGWVIGVAREILSGSQSAISIAVGGVVVGLIFGLMLCIWMIVTRYPEPDDIEYNIGYVLKLTAAGAATGCVLALLDTLFAGKVRIPEGLGVYIVWLTGFGGVLGFLLSLPLGKDFANAKRNKDLELHHDMPVLPPEEDPLYRG